MPSTRPLRRTRRGVLAGLGTALTASLAGCGGRLPGTAPARIDATATVEDDEIRWAYPPTDGDREGIGYAAVSFDRLVRRDRTAPAMRLECNSTIGGLASSVPYRNYRPDWFRFRIAPPASYASRTGFAVRVEPPGQWEGFGAYYDTRGGRRWFVAELRGVDTQGTIIVPVVFDPQGESLPTSLHCSFTVQASRPGPLGKTVRATGDGTLDVEAARDGGS